MHLVRTGAFVRATRAARLATPWTPASVARAIGSRWQSSQAAEQPQESFPEQSVLVNQELGARKTAQSNEPKEEGETRSFRRWVREQQDEGKIYGRGKLHGTKICGRAYVLDETSNLSPSILDLVGRSLYNIPNHPICITRRLIEDTFSPSFGFKNHIATDPVVTTHANFDVLGFPPDHPGRSRTDTYYVDSSHVLRTHTSAHQHTAFVELAQTTKGASGYTICADVYRRDSIDRSHFPVFHQMEGAYLWQLPQQRNRYQATKQRIESLKTSLASVYERAGEIAQASGEQQPVVTRPHLITDTNPQQFEQDEAEIRLAINHMMASLEVLVYRVFEMAHRAGVGSQQNSTEPLQMRWIEAYFPFTTPSFELEVYWQGEWLELLGCGIVQLPILKEAGLHDRIGWAWGIGIERLAMLVFGIPDIRLFWSKDPRFLGQFTAGKITRFEPFSKYPACYKDISFWIDAAPPAASPVHPSADPGVAAAAGGNATKASSAETQPAAFHENDVMEIVRDVGGTLIEDVRLVDEFVHPQTGRKSLCYRINYRSLERTLTNEETNALHEKLRQRIVGDLGVELR